nr:hypothetical protein GCM10020185_13090 [Pseudomonas brassicacearum subsp. brassicacearum]
MIDLVHPADRQRTLEAAREIMDGEPKLNFENRYLRKDGRVVHILWSARWSPVDQLRIAVARDITERKQAESRQAALYAISEAAHAAADLLALFKRIHLIIGEWLPALNFFRWRCMTNNVRNLTSPITSTTGKGSRNCRARSPGVCAPK